MDMLRRLLRTPRADVEVGVAIPIGCMVPLAITAAVLVGAAVLIGTRLQAATSSLDRVTVRVIDYGAPDGPRVLSTQVVPLR
jgi:hypothetical protein